MEQLPIWGLVPSEGCKRGRYRSIGAYNDIVMEVRWGVGPYLRCIGPIMC